MYKRVDSLHVKNRLFLYFHVFIWKVIKTSSDITSVRAKEKCLKWAAEKIRGMSYTV